MPTGIVQLSEESEVKTKALKTERLQVKRHPH